MNTYKFPKYIGLTFACIFRVILVVLIASSSVHAGLQCEAGTNYTGPYYPDLESAISKLCESTTGNSRVGAVTSLGPVVNDYYAVNVVCETYESSAGIWKEYSGGSASCHDPSELYLDSSNVDKDGQGNGQSPVSSCHPINLLNGNKYKVHTDISSADPSGMPRPQFVRYYNSQDFKSGNHVIGLNWRHTYQRRIFPEGAFRAGTNVALATNGTSSNLLQSTPVNDRQTACLSGFQELINNSNSNPSAFGNMKRIINGTVSWTGSKCVVNDEYGNYVATIPMFVHIDGAHVYGPGILRIRLVRSDGKEYVFNRDLTVSGINWLPEDSENTGKLSETVSYSVDSNGLLTIPTATFEYVGRDNIKETYDQSGKLLSIDFPDGVVQTLTYSSGVLNKVEDNLGRSITFSYNSDNRIEYITDETGRQWHYQYDSEGRLITVTNPDSTSKQYHYEDTNPTNLTGLTDERNIRYSTFDYYSDGLAKDSYLGTPTDPPNLKIDNVNIAYGSGVNTVTDSRGYKRTYHYGSNVVGGEIFKDLLTQFDGPECNGCAGGSSSFQYDINTTTPSTSTLNLLSKTEYGVATDYSNYDKNHNPQTITEASGTSEQRQKAYTYDSRYQHKIATITEPSVHSGSNKVTTYSYDDFGNTTAVTIDGFKPDGVTAVTRTTSYTYAGPYHQLSQIDGPRSDVSDVYTLNYYPDDPTQGNNRARLQTITAPENIVLRDNITYTPTGKIAAYTGANGLQVAMNYYAGNDRLELLTQTDSNTGNVRQTHWTYLATGEVETVTTGYQSMTPTTLTFEYDDARRLTRIYDGLGNYIKYTLDTEGNVEDKNVYDTAGNLKKALHQTYDAYNRLDISTQVNESMNTDFQPNGTLGQKTDGEGVVTKYGYDALNRLATVTQDASGAGLISRIGYDTQDNVTSVTDPNNGNTTYSYDDLGNLVSRTSPDTGTTTYAYDDAGNMVSKTDAAGNVFSYTYDALNRPTFIDLPGPAGARDTIITYDNCIGGMGHICSLSRGTNSIVDYTYNAFGDITSHQGISYTYDEAGRMSTMTYPSGGVVRYEYNAAGKVDRVSLIRNGNTLVLASSITHMPFGEINALTYGNSLTLDHQFDEAYRTQSLGVAAAYKRLYSQYDMDGNIKEIDDVLNSNSDYYGYDKLNRLHTATGVFGSLIYNYDNNGNRVSLDDSSVVTTYQYEATANPSNRLDSIGADDVVVDAVGNTKRKGEWYYFYTPDNRLMQVNHAGNLMKYTYNGLGQRRSKIIDSKVTSFTYGLSGELLSEVSNGGVESKEYIYLDGKPLAMLETTASSSGPSVTQTTTPSQIGDSVGVAWAGISAPVSHDWVGVYEVGAPDNEYLDWIYTGGSAEGSSQITLSDFRLVAGNTYELRLYANDGYTRLATSAPFVLNTTAPTLIAATTPVMLGRSVNLAWSGITAPTSLDWVGVYEVGAPDNQYKDWQYTSGTSAGSVGLTLQHQSLTVGTTYEFRLYANNGYTLIAKSAPFVLKADNSIPASSLVYYIHNDHLGTPMAMTDETGATVWRATHDPFGMATVNEDVDGNGVKVSLNLRFPGQYYDAETGLHYNYNRYYDPTTGRYMTSDPIGLLGGLNTYGYALGNPLGWIDPLGLDVTVTVTRTGYTQNAISGTINVTSTVTDKTFSGNTIENIHPDNPNLPVKPGTYPASSYPHSPVDRILLDVPKATYVEIHNANYPSQLKGCFGVGTTGNLDSVSNSIKAMNEINSIISADGTNNIKVIVVGGTHP